MTNTSAADTLANRVILVTGAANGIGAAISTNFAREGAHVVGCDVNWPESKSLEYPTFAILTCDLSDPVAVEEMVSEVLTRYEKIDVLVNNAGIVVKGNLAEINLAQSTRVISVNLIAPLHLMSAVIPHMKARHYGRIINVISRAAERCPPGMSSYAATKAGLYALSVSVAKEVHDSGILVNCLIPGPVSSSMNPLGTNSPESVYPTARWLASLPDNGPTGGVYWDMKQYPLYKSNRPDGQVTVDPSGARVEVS